MILKGRYYMHEQSSAMCVKIIEKIDNSTFEVEWYDVGSVATPLRQDGSTDIIYMHPGVWRDITEFLKEPQESWN